ncbi:GTP-binding protein [Nonomuraea candida]|uniref:GTP-binding protein n=1 Tax=Nonomuraea candida TaxID=359159 RepID=UPI0005BD538E|nr:GTP-binding protein [Nonomuraea candida]
MRTPVALVAGLHRAARAAAVDRLLRRHPGAVAIHHHVRPGGEALVERVVRDVSGVLGRTSVRPAHGRPGHAAHDDHAAHDRAGHAAHAARDDRDDRDDRVTRAVRDDLLPELLRRSPAASLLVVELWDAVEPRAVAEAVAAPEAAGRLRLACVHTALHAGHLPVDICRGDRLCETGRAIPGDRRFLAEVLARQIEYATSLSLHGGDPEDAELAAAVLAHLAPHTPIVPRPRLAGGALCVRELAERVDPGTAQLPADAQTGEVTTVVWHRLRPLHPVRLFAAMDELAASTVRSRGRFWLANRPHRMLAWEAAAGEVSVSDAGPWLAALPGAAWELARPARRAAAALDWNPIIGDRVQHLVFTGPGLDRGRIVSLLDSCLIGPDDILPGSAEWAGRHDPFAPVLDLKERA